MNDSERTIVETKKICDYVGCNLNIIYIPNSIFWKPDAFSEKYRKRLLKFSMKLNIQFVDTTNILNRNEGSLDYAIKGPHLSPLGYKKVVDLIVKKSN